MSATTPQAVLKHRNREWLILLIMLLATLLSQVSVLAFSGLGGYITEKTLGGAASALLHLSSSTSGPTVLGSAPRVTVFSPIVSGQNVKLRGNVEDMNGFPSAGVYFRWGYSPSTMTNNTPTQTATIAGVYTADIVTAGPVEGTVYHQFVAEGDGTNYSSTQSFKTVPTTVFNTANMLVLAFALAAVVALFVILYMITQGAAALPLLITAAIATIIAVIGITVFIGLVRGLW